MEFLTILLYPVRYLAAFAVIAWTVNKLFPGFIANVQKLMEG